MNESVNLCVLGSVPWAWQSSTVQYFSPCQSPGLASQWLLQEQMESSYSSGRLSPFDCGLGSDASLRATERQGWAQSLHFGDWKQKRREKIGSPQWRKWKRLWTHGHLSMYFNKDEVAAKELCTFPEKFIFNVQHLHFLSEYTPLA